MEKEIDKNQEATTEDSSIYIYFKDHPNLLIACISAVAAITTFVFNAVLYFGDYKYFQYWGFDISRIEWSRTNELYIFGAMLLFYICNGIIQSFEATTFLVYRKKMKYVNAVRWMLNCEAHELKQRDKEHLKVKRGIKKLEKKANKVKVGDEVAKEIEEIHTRATETEDRIKSLKEKHLHAKEAAKNLKCGLIKRLIGHIILATITSSLLLLVLLLAVSNITINRWLWVLFALACSVIMTTAAYFAATILYPGFKKSTLKQIMGDNEQFLTFLHQYENQDLSTQDYPLHKWREYSLREVLSNRNIISTMGECVFYIFVILILFVFTADKRIEGQKVFPIYQEDESAYAIIYHSKNTFYMDKVEWVDDTITVDVSKQRIITVNDISYEKRTFDNVNRISSGK